ncbi:hypothetical protein [Streptomyces sp. NPDC054849]
MNATTKAARLQQAAYHARAAAALFTELADEARAAGQHTEADWLDASAAHYLAGAERTA